VFSELHGQVSTAVFNTMQSLSPSAYHALQKHHHNLPVRVAAYLSPRVASIGVTKHFAAATMAHVSLKTCTPARHHTLDRTKQQPTTTMSTVDECIGTLTKNAELKSFFAQCNNVAEEFKALKKAYFKLVLEVHPDKGGTKEEFIKVRASFEMLRDLFNSNGIESFEKEAGLGMAGFGGVKQRMLTGAVPSWAFYEDAAQDEMPAYKVELGA
jgi:hypothetical protein